MKILFIRRDNIGDLVCTTPAIHAVREKYHDAKIGILVNTYNAEIVANNPDIDEIYVYEKAKHAPDKNKLPVWWSNIKVLGSIRKEKYDIAIGCGSYSPRLARYTFLIGAKTRIGYSKKSKFYNLPVAEPEQPLHEVEKTFNLLSPLGINTPPPTLRIFPSDEEVKKTLQCINASGIKTGKPLIAFHISSRRPVNRWPVEKFIELGRLVANHCEADILLLWSPGSERNPYHPGDDEKAAIFINSAVPGTIAYKTDTLGELIAVLSLSSLVVCCDGGAMHIAAALGKPIVAIWGSTDPKRWRPWGVKHTLIQSGAKKAEDVDVNAVFVSVKELFYCKITEEA